MTKESISEETVKSIVAYANEMGLSTVDNYDKLIRSFLTHYRQMRDWMNTYIQRNQDAAKKINDNEVTIRYITEALSVIDRIIKGERPNFYRISEEYDPCNECNNNCE